MRLVRLAAFKDNDNALRQGWREREGFAVFCTIAGLFFKFDLDAELIGWLDNPFFVFVWQSFKGYTTSFELPFLFESHKLKIFRATTRTSELVKDNEKKKVRAVAKGPEGKLRGRRVLANLLPEDVGDLTLEHLKKAARGLRRCELDLIDLLRFNGEEIMNQLEE